MAKTFGHKSDKHEKVDRENTKIVSAVGVAAFIVVFGLFSVRALVSQSLYQGKVISEKEATLDQLEDNRASVDNLRNLYTAFVSESENVIGGSPDGDGPKDGDNAKIVLDALPGEFDYPGVASSLEKILTDGGYRIESIGGTEDASLAGSDSSAAVDVPYPFSIRASPKATENLLNTLESSIRPIYVDSLTIRSNEGGLRTSFGIRTFYQPGVDFSLGEKVVRQ
jgi:hypothetical protein